MEEWSYGWVQVVRLNNGELEVESSKGAVPLREQSSPGLDAYLGKAGAQGWEIAGILPDINNTLLIFLKKRTQ